MPRNLLIQMSGAPGSGKSTIASLLSQSLNAIIINHDLIKSFFLSHSIPFDQSSRLTYGLDWILAEDMIKQGRNVIVDSTCNFKEVVEQGVTLAGKYGWVYRYVECRVEDLEVLDRRLRNREPLRCQRTGVDGPPDGAGNLEDGKELFRRWIENPWRPDAVEVVIVVDSSKGLEKCLEYILNQIVHEAIV